LLPNITFPKFDCASFLRKIDFAVKPKHPGSAIDANGGYLL
jgi:hypothetical protein